MSTERFPGYSQHREKRVRDRITAEHRARVMRKIIRARRRHQLRGA